MEDYLVDVNGVAELLSCSSRHVFRLTEAGKMPKPVRLGSLVRWSQVSIQSWIEAGCPSRMENTSRKKSDDKTHKYEEALR